ncbi:MAG: SusC/RagA family TonB-linked outer membrane protein [Leadbetterella sp.]
MNKSIRLQKKINPFLKFCLLFLVAFQSAFAQRNNYTIKGKVSDSFGSLPGVSIRVMGLSLGTTTDLDGEYVLSLNLSEGSYSLVFSSVGYTNITKKITLANETLITENITMSTDGLNLDELIVTGSTSKQSRRELGNAISQISSDQLVKSGTNNLFGAMQGKVPGAQITQNSGDPAGGMTIRLRGIKSIRGDSDPLYVIDGVIVSNSSTNVSQTALANQVGAATPGTNRMADINPNDIENISVLNGSAAAAQYGSRAANGVVLITTKRGKSGAPKVSFTSSFNVNELRKKVFISTYGKQFGWTGLRLHTIGAVTPASITANNPSATFVPITRDGVATNLATNLVDVTRYDYQDDIFQTGIGTDNSISITGGNDKTQYFTSASYMKNQGIIKGTDFNRYNLRARLDQRINSWAKFSAGLSYTNSFANEKANGNVFYSPINSVNITNNIYDISIRDVAGALKAVEPTRVNPLSTIEDMDFTQQVSRTINDIQLNLNPFKGLTLDWVAGVDSYNQLGRNLINPYPYQAEAGLPVERYPSGYASNVNNVVTLFNNDVTANYEKKLSEKLNLRLTGGFNYQQQQSDFARASGENLAPFIETVSGAASTTVGAGYGLDKFNLSGSFLQGTFGYDNLAYVTAAIRRDRSSKFSPSETNQFYPKLSASFVPSDLKFWKNSNVSSIFSGFKTRISWGQSGNLTGIGSYDRFWQFNPVPFLGKNTITPNTTFANPSVRPERMTELEGGIDLAFLKNKMNLGITMYKQLISDLVVNRVLASSTGGLGIVNNVGEMENKGVEIQLNIIPIKNQDFSWDFTLIYNSNRNLITKLGSPSVSLSNSAGAPVFLVEGQPATIFLGNPYARNPDGSLLLTPQGLPQRERGTQSTLTTFVAERDDKGQPKGAFVRSIIGNPNPKWTGSFVNSLSYKKFNFGFMLDAVQGLDVFNADKRTRNNVGIGDIAEKELKGESPRGSVFALVPIEEYRVDDGSFVKLREISLGYQLPKLIKGVNSMSVNLIGRNLKSWDKYNGYDPETNAGGNSDLVRGIDFGNVPIPKTYQVQLSIAF